MKYLSVCSGIEAATVAWHPLGWSPVAFAEVDKFPSSVLAHHYPHVPNFGDMTKFKEWPDANVDVLVGGTPCQSFSVAGLRKGLADPRGNLALVYLAIADRYRPEWLLWENVPGVLSSNGGRDFGAFLGGLGELGYGFAYRVLDAQYVRVDGFGRAVPQRRRRVFVVGNSRSWRRAAAVLFEPESLSWNSPPSRKAGKGFTQAVAPSIVSSGRGVERAGDTRGQDPVIAVPPISHCLNAGGMGRQDYETETVIAVAHALRADGFDASEDGTGRGTPFVPINFQTRGSNIDYEQGLAATLGSNADRASGSAPCIAFSAKDYGGDAEVDLSPTLRAGGFTESHANAGVMPAIAFSQNQCGDVLTGDVMHALQTNSNATGRSSPNVLANWAVRRLTPRECERLQGFPDDYTLIPVRGKPAADGPRYKALGNSMACNVMRWLGRRIDLVTSLSLLQQESK